MGAFTLDTRGSVPAIDGGVYYFTELEPFKQGYVEAAFAEVARCPDVSHGGHRFGGSLKDGRVQSCERCGIPIDGMGGKNLPQLAFHMLAPETLAAMVKDCERFARRRPASYNGDNASAFGRLFWGNRQASCYDRFPCFPSLTIFVDDDGLIRTRATSQKAGA